MQRYSTAHLRIIAKSAQQMDGREPTKRLKHRSRPETIKETMNRLPTELQIQILESCSSSDRLRLVSVCKLWYSILRVSVLQAKRYGHTSECVGYTPNRKHYGRCWKHPRLHYVFDDNQAHIEKKSRNFPNIPHRYPSFLDDGFEYIHGFLGNHFGFIHLVFETSLGGVVKVKEIKLGDEGHGRWVLGWDAAVDSDDDLMDYLEKVMGRSYKRQLDGSTLINDTFWAAYEDYHDYSSSEDTSDEDDIGDEDYLGDEYKTSDTEDNIAQTNEWKQEKLLNGKKETAVEGPSGMSNQDEDDDPVDLKTAYSQISGWEDEDRFNLIQNGYKSPQFPDDITDSAHLDTDPLIHPFLSRDNTKLFLKVFQVEFNPRGFWWKLEHNSSTEQDTDRLISIFPGVEELLLDRSPMRTVFDFMAKQMSASEFRRQVLERGRADHKIFAMRIWAGSGGRRQPW